MTTLAERIQKIIDAGFTQIELARAAGVTKGTTNQWLNGGIKSIKLEYAQGIETLTGFSAEWLVTGKGSPRRDAASPEEEVKLEIPGARNVMAVSDDEETPGIVRIRKVRLKLSAGIMGFQTEAYEEDDNPISFRINWLEKRGYVREKLIAIPVKGESMEPLLYDGDTVVINTADTKPKDGDVYAVNYEGEAIIKRLVRDYGFWWLVSDNADQRRYPRKQCSGDMCLIIGKVVHRQSERF